MESVTLDSEPVELAFQTDRHRVGAVISDERPAGRHTAVFSYSVSGGSMPTRDGWRTHIRLLNRGHEADDVITIEAAPGVAAIGVRCVTFAPDAYPCGSKAADQSWVYLDGPIRGTGVRRDRPRRPEAHRSTETRPHLSPSTRTPELVRGLAEVASSTECTLGASRVVSAPPPCPEGEPCT